MRLHKEQNRGGGMKYNRLYPNIKVGETALNGKLLRSPWKRPCEVCKRRTLWFRTDLNARVCSEECATISEKRQEKVDE